MRVTLGKGLTMAAAAWAATLHGGTMLAQRQASPTPRISYNPDSNVLTRQTDIVRYNWWHSVNDHITEEWHLSTSDDDHLGGGVMCLGRESRGFIWGLVPTFAGGETMLCGRAILQDDLPTIKGMIGQLPSYQQDWVRQRGDIRVQSQDMYRFRGDSFVRGFDRSPALLALPPRGILDPDQAPRLEYEFVPAPDPAPERPEMDMDSVASDRLIT